jgi:hypothetical protein
MKIPIIVSICMLSAWALHGQDVQFDNGFPSRIDYFMNDDSSGIDSVTGIIPGAFVGLTIGSKAEKVTFRCNGKVMNQFALQNEAATVSFSDMNGDGYNEIILGTYPNMNANHWFEVFTYSKQKKKFVRAGEFSSDFVVYPTAQYLLVHYEGSSYMETTYELYKWHGDKLVQERMVVWLPGSRNPHTDYAHFEIYENPSHKPNGIKCVAHRKILVDNGSTFFNGYRRQYLTEIEKGLNKKNSK